MIITLVSINLGQYTKYLDVFLKSASSFLFPGQPLKLFVFTDNALSSSHKLRGNPATIIHNDFLGWPFSTLYRYHLFQRLPMDAYNSDYIIFFNANTQFVRPINLYEFFSGSPDLICGVHPGFINKPYTDYPFEHRVASCAYLSPQPHHYYFQGCINGFKTESFKQYIDTLSINIDSDLKRGIVSVWHDESHWNKLCNLVSSSNPQKVKPLSPAKYLHPSHGFFIPNT